MRLQGGTNPQRTAKVQVTSKPQITKQVQRTVKTQRTPKSGINLNARQLNAIKVSPKGVLPSFLKVK